MPHTSLSTDSIHHAVSHSDHIIVLPHDNHARDPADAPSEPQTGHVTAPHEHTRTMQKPARTPHIPGDGRRNAPTSIFNQQDVTGRGVRSRPSSDGREGIGNGQRTGTGTRNVAGGEGKNSGLLSSLRVTRIVGGKPALPVEIITVILDHSSPSTLICCARVSRRLKDLVYKETRWIRRLQLIGTWDEELARRHHEETLQRRNEVQAARSSFGPLRNVQVHGRQTGSGLVETLFDVLGDGGGPKSTSMVQQQRTPNDGFSDLILSGGTAAAPKAIDERSSAASVLRQAKSIPGQARQTYGRIHALLSPLYRDATDMTEGSGLTADPLVFRITSDVRERAQILANLLRFATTDDEAGRRERGTRLQTLVALFENRILNDFHAAYGREDEGGMRTAVDVLVILEKGDMALRAYIDSHRLLNGNQDLVDPQDSIEGVVPGHVNLAPSRRLFEHLAAVCSDQSRLIDHVFPPEVDALTAFLHTVCGKLISPFVGTVLEMTREKSEEAYLKAVAGVFEQAMRFSVSLQPTRASTKSFRHDVQVDLVECFTAHLDAYLTGEVTHFRAKAEEEVQAWDKQMSDQTAQKETFYMSKVNRQAAKRDFLSSFRKVVMLPVNAVAAFPIPGSGSRADRPPDLKNGSAPETGTMPNGYASALGEAPATELAAKAAVMNSRLEGIKSLFSIELALNTVHHAKAAIERIAIVARYGGPPYDKSACRQCEIIFTTLLDIIGQRHIKAGFDAALGHLSVYNPRQMRGEDSSDPRSGVAPLTTFLELVNVGDLIQQMLDVFFMQELVAARLTDTDDFLNPAAKAKKAFEQMLDERVAAGMSKGIDVLIDEVEYLCATTQSATDYNPGAAAVDGPLTPTFGGSGLAIMDIGPTKTATQVVQLVQTHTDLLVGSTDKTMLDVFFQEVGLRLFATLCKHIKRQRISANGAIKLISDINLYSTFVSTLKQKPLAPYFTALRELSQIYLVDCGATSGGGGLMSPTISSQFPTISFSSAPSSPSTPAGTSFSPPDVSASEPAKQRQRPRPTKAAQAERAARAKELATIIADNERYRGVFAADEVLEFAERRTDWFVVRADVERAMYGIGCMVM